jgi:carbon monoxide dehydrogenase subunit G
MDFTATYNVSASVPAVWNLLMDPTAIADCLPGCRELVPVGGDQYQAELTVGVAAISGTFEVTIALADLVPPQSYRLNVEATGTPGFASGTASIVLRADGDGTTVVVAAEVQAGGLIARVGQRLLESVARMTMDGFFGCLAKRLGGAGILGSS